MISRETMEDGALRVRGERWEFVHRRLRPGVMLTVAAGYDNGELAEGMIREVSAEIARYRPVLWFLDARGVTGVTTAVREAFTAWFESNRSEIGRVGILVGSKFMYLAVSLGKLFSGTGELIRIYSDVRQFHDAVAREAPGWSAPPEAAGGPAGDNGPNS